MFRTLFRNSQSLHLDNLIFRLHYRFTVGLLLACAVALLWKITYGDPLSCVDRDGNSGVYINDHCWYNGMYTYPLAYDAKVGVDAVAPGVTIRKTDEPLLYHNVHRWVIVGILVQAAFFFVPRIIWRAAEGGLMRRWVWSMNDARSSDSLTMFRKQLIGDCVRSDRLGGLLYVGGHVLAELLNLVNVVAQLGLVCHILQMYGGVSVLFSSVAERPPSVRSFPIELICNLYKFGPSGVVQRHNLKCVASVNGVMESIFVCQSIWFTLLAVLSGLALFYRVSTLVVPQLRALRLQSKTKLTPGSTVESATRQLNVGQWFMLYMLSKNLDPIHMRDILEAIRDGKNAYGQGQPMDEITPIVK